MKDVPSSLPQLGLLLPDPGSLHKRKGWPQTEGLDAALFVQFLRNLHSPAIVIKDGGAQDTTFRIRQDKRPRSGRDRHPSKLHLAGFLLQAFDNHLANGAYGLPPFTRGLLVDSPWGAVVLTNLLIRFR